MDIRSFFARAGGGGPAGVRPASKPYQLVSPFFAQQRRRREAGDADAGGGGVGGCGGKRKPAVPQDADGPAVDDEDVDDDDAFQTNAQSPPKKLRPGGSQLAVQPLLPVKQALPLHSSPAQLGVDKRSSPVLQAPTPPTRDAPRRLELKATGVVTLQPPPAATKLVATCTQPARPMLAPVAAPAFPAQEPPAPLMCSKLEKPSASTPVLLQDTKVEGAAPPGRDPDVQQCSKSGNVIHETLKTEPSSSWTPNGCTFTKASSAFHGKQLARGPPSPVLQEELWTAKHRPHVVAEVIGNSSQIQRLRQWLLDWDKHHGPGGHRQNSQKGAGRGGVGRSKAGDTDKKAVLLYGAPGLGKTSTANLVCRELGYSCIEVNASDSRGKADRDIKQGVNGKGVNTFKELISNQTISFAKAGRQKVALIMDEVDGMSGGDKGGVQELVQSIQTTKIPIICICNGKYSPKVKSLVNSCLELSFQKPIKGQVMQRLLQIARKEGVQTDEFFRSTSNSFRSQDVNMQAGVFHKNQELSPFIAADRLLGMSKNLTMDDRIDLVFQDADLVPLLIQEDYLNYKPASCRSDHQRLECVARAADCVAIGDMVNSRVRQQQRWDLMPFGAIASSTASAFHMCGVREPFAQGERNFNRFSAWLGKNSSTSKSWRQLAELQLHLLVSGNCSASKDAIRQDYMRNLCSSLTEPLLMHDKEGIREVLDTMYEYCITREDRDNIVELVQLQGMPDPCARIASQVKSACMRAYNQEAAGVSVKSSCLLPNAKGKHKVTMAAREVQMVDADTGTASVEEDLEMEEDASQGVLQPIPGVKKSKEVTAKRKGGVR
eukprot:SM000165S02216  [mRNA]  locus=s165:238181:243560:+ [translate_table: standard]